MPTCRRTTLVEAEFETVWTFYDDVAELEVLTPDWMGLRVAQVIGPDGQATSDPDGYRPGTEIHLEWQPAGVLPASEWVVEITDRSVEPGSAIFVDEQVGGRGPYDSWRHVHRFEDLGGETMVHDEVTYRAPGAGDLPVATPLLAAMLWYRHRRTRSLLEE